MSRWIKLISGMSGTRANDAKYPPIGVPFEVDGWEAQNLLHAGVAVDSGPPPGWEPPPPPEPPVEVKAALEAEPLPPKPAARPDAEPPAPSAPVHAWREYALTQGANPSEVNGLSKAQLQAVYGGRL